jgi:hypothetical protein
MAINFGSAVRKVGGVVKQGGETLGDGSDGTGSEIARKVGEFGGKYMKRKPKPKPAPIKLGSQKAM